MQGEDMGRRFPMSGRQNRGLYKIFGCVYCLNNPKAPLGINH
jgi:hypothetical protein